MSIKAHADRSTTKGRRTVCDPGRNRNSVETENPMPVDADGLVEETFSVEEIFSELDRKLKEHYGLKI